MQDHITKQNPSNTSNSISLSEGNDVSIFDSQRVNCNNPEIKKKKKKKNKKN